MSRQSRSTGSILDSGTRQAITTGSPLGDDPYGNGANRVDLAYCTGGNAQGAFTTVGVCAGGGTLTTALQGKGSTLLSLTIPTGTARAFQATTRVRNNGQDTTDTISVEVSTSDVTRRGVSTS